MVDANTINVSLSTSLNTPLPAHIGETPLDLYNKETDGYYPFGTLVLPALDVNHKTNATITNQTVAVKNHTELVKWFNKLFMYKEVDLSLYGKPHVSLGELHSNPTLDKTITLNALDQLRNFGIEDLDIALPPPKSGKNIKGTLNLPNWGNLTLSFGNLTLALEAADIRLGQVTINDVVLNPGNNTCPFEGTLDLGKLIKNLGPILKVEADHLADGKIQLNTTGISTIVNGQHIGFVEEVLNTRTLSFEIAVTTLLTDLVAGIVGGDGLNGILDTVSDTVGNDTFIQDVLDHWNHTKPDNGTNPLKALTGLKRRNGQLGGSFLWKMVQLGLKSQRARA